eukprot:13513791-Ditylum_brightwellii.AAC.1
MALDSIMLCSLVMGLPLRRLATAFNKVVLPDLGGPRTKYMLPDCMKDLLCFLKISGIARKDVDRAETWNR